MFPAPQEFVSECQNRPPKSSNAGAGNTTARARIGRWRTEHPTPNEFAASFSQIDRRGDHRKTPARIGHLRGRLGCGATGLAKKPGCPGGARLYCAQR
jgi:hypothetical protein